MIPRINSTALYIKVFQFFGSHFVHLTNATFHSKFQKYLAYHAYIYFVLVVSFGIGTLTNFIRTLVKNEKNNLMESIMFIGIYSVGIFAYMLNFYFRKSDQKFWKIYREIENLNERFLKVKLDATTLKSFNFFLVAHFSVIFIKIVLSTVTIKDVNAKNFNGYLNLMKLFAYHWQFFWIKYVFYVKIIDQQIKRLQDCQTLSQENYLVQQRIWTCLWKMSKNLEKAFRFQIVMITCFMMFAIIFSGYFLAFNIFSKRLIVPSVAYLFVPFIPFTFAPINCQQCIDKVCYSRYLLGFPLLTTINNIYYRCTS